MTINPQAKFHHHVPVFLVKRWASDGERVAVWNKYHGRVSNRLPREVLGEKFANRFIEFDGTTNHSVETRLSKSESEFALAVERFHELDTREQTHQFSEAISNDLLRLFWNMATRSPLLRRKHRVDEEFLNEHVDAVTRTIQRNGIKFNFDVERILNPGTTRENIKNQINVQAFGEISESPPIETLNFGLARLKTRVSKKTFVLGLNPIQPIAFDEKGHKLHILPTSPNVAIAPFGRKGLIFNFSITDQSLREYNERVWDRSNEVVAMEEKLLLSLSTRHQTQC